jgi:hypothetical protein
MKAIILAVVFVGLMSAQSYGAAAPQVGQGRSLETIIAEMTEDDKLMG